jgi:GTPase involved in cell partitioning and DNA repair
MSRTLNEIAMVGNPGVGKSTILNSLIGMNIFESGLSPGVGLTKALGTIRIDDTIYYDTPGLSDIVLRKQAAEAIKELFMTSNNLKIFFVIKLRGARCEADDVCTLNVILDSLDEDVSNRFGIIINQASTEEIELYENPILLSILKGLLSSKHETSFILFVSEDMSIRNKNNMVLNESIRFIIQEFIETLPNINYFKEKIKDINHLTIDDVIAETTERMRIQREQMTKEFEQKISELEKAKKNNSSEAVINALSRSLMMFKTYGLSEAALYASNNPEKVDYCINQVKKYFKFK